MLSKISTLPAENEYFDLTASYDNFFLLKYHSFSKDLPEFFKQE